MTTSSNKDKGEGKIEKIKLSGGYLDGKRDIFTNIDGVSMELIDKINEIIDKINLL